MCPLFVSNILPPLMSSKWVWLGPVPVAWVGSPEVPCLLVKREGKLSLSRREDLMPHRNYVLGTWANKIGRAVVGPGEKVHLWPSGKETGNRRSAGGNIAVFITPLKETSRCNSCWKEKGFPCSNGSVEKIPSNEVLGNSLCLHIWRVMLWYHSETHTPHSSRWMLCPAGKDASTSGGWWPADRERDLFYQRRTQGPHRTAVKNYTVSDWIKSACEPSHKECTVLKHCWFNSPALGFVPVHN